MSYVVRVCCPIVTALVCLQLIPPLIAQESVTVTVDASTQVRANSRHLMGHNLSFVESAYRIWNPDLGEFEDAFWQPFKKVTPGIMRFPGGNWTYGYHFDLARQGIAHVVNAERFGDASQDFRPQHFLKLINDLNTQGIESTPLIHPSAQFTSPEEAAAWVAYMISPSDRNCRVIGPDSWGRKYNGEELQWRTTCHWGLQREIDNPDDPSPYTGTLYLQFGNEEWSGFCSSCNGLADAYGNTRSSRSMTIQQETANPRITAYWPKYQALWAKLRGPEGLFTADEVQVGALGYASILDPRGIQDRSLNNRDDWNYVLLTKIRNDPDTNLDYLTLHSYNYGKNGWQKRLAKGVG